jgi:hypothetical protein
MTQGAHHEASGIAVVSSLLFQFLAGCEGNGGFWINYGAEQISY